MDALHVVLALMAVGGAAAAVVLGVRYAAARGEARALAERAGRAESESLRAADEARASAAQVDALSERNRSLEVGAMALQKDLERVKAESIAELESVENLNREREEARSRSEQQFREDTARQIEELKHTFRALAGQALSTSTQDFLKLAREQFEKHTGAAGADLEKRREAVERMVAPIAEALKKTDEKLQSIEQSRTASYADLKSKIEDIGRAGGELRAETGKLVRALREPKVRGMYGEVQLKRVAELAGMREYCDFTEQESTRDAEGNALRPDMLVRLPSGRTLAVDAKANLKPYLEAIEATDPAEVDGHLQAFADGIARQAALLARKEYWKQFEGSPEFVVMFVPGDQFVDAALAKRPDLLDVAAGQRVLLASPSTLIALLRAVQVGFQEQRLAEEAKELRELGKELHERAAAAMEHVSKLGAALEKSMEHYNRFVGSYEQRLRPTLKKFEETGTKGTKELVDVKPVNVQARLPEGKWELETR